MKHKSNTSSNNKLPLLGLAVLSFAFFAVFGLSLITGNQQDSGVGSSQASAQEPADINSDAVVDIVDLSILLSKWGSVTAPPTANTAYERGLAWYQQNTGVPAGTSLTASGGLTINTAGTVIDGKDISGDVVINAQNVTIKNSRIRGSIWVNHNQSTYNTIIEYVDIDLSGIAIDSSGNSNKYGVSAPYGTTVRFSKIHGMAQGIAFGGYLTAEDNHIYNIRSKGMHSESILSNGDNSAQGGNAVIARNWLDAEGSQASGWVSGALCMYGDWGQIRNTIVDGNYLSGGGYTLYAGNTAAKPYPLPYNVEVKNNTFDANGYAYGPVYPNPMDSLSQSKWFNNKLTTGATVNSP